MPLKYKSKITDPVQTVVDMINTIGRVSTAKHYSTYPTHVDAFLYRNGATKRRFWEWDGKTKPNMVAKCIAAYCDENGLSRADEYFHRWDGYCAYILKSSGYKFKIKWTVKKEVPDNV